MDSILYGIFTQWKIDIRNKGILMVYYAVPLVFFVFMGGIFSSINPAASATLCQTMIVFAISMGAFLGTPVPLVELLNSDIKKTYIVSGMPLWMVVLNNFVSALIHLTITSHIILAVCPILFKTDSLHSRLTFYTGMMFLVVVSCLIGSILGLTVKKINKLTLLSQCLFLPSVMISGIMFSRDLLPKVLAKTAILLPATWGYDIMTSTKLSLNALLVPIITICVCLCLIGYLTSRLYKD